MKIMRFEHIIDSRFEGENTKDVFDMTFKQILDNLNNLPGVVTGNFDPYMIDWENGSYQWRVEVWVRKDSRETTWNDIYEAINKVKPARYNFCEASLIFN